MPELCVVLQCAEVIFADDNLIIVNKRSDVPVIPGRGANSVRSLRELIEEEIGKKIFVVHRIDRATSGIIIFARNSETHRSLCNQFEMRVVEKEYSAVVLGSMEGQGVIQKPLRQFGSGRMGVHDNGKPSMTRYEVVENYATASLIKVFPLTGRRHQIRVHLYDAGYPVLGDPVYGKNRPVGGITRLMLHARSLKFRYPGNTEFSVSAPTDREWDTNLSIIKETITSSITRCSN